MQLLILRNQQRPLSVKSCITIKDLIKTTIKGFGRLKDHRRKARNRFQGEPAEGIQMESETDDEIHEIEFYCFCIMSSDKVTVR